MKFDMKEKVEIIVMSQVVLMKFQVFKRDLNLSILICSLASIYIKNTEQTQTANSYF